MITAFFTPALITLNLLLPQLVQAGPSNTAPTPAVAEGGSEKATCKQIGDMAESLMTARQTGLAISVIFEAIAPVTPSDAATSNALKRMVLNAYEEPAWNSEDVKQKSIRDFRDQWEVECYSMEASK